MRKAREEWFLLAGWKTKQRRKFKRKVDVLRSNPKKCIASLLPTSLLENDVIAQLVENCICE
jgi:hypothetical protein